MSTAGPVGGPDPLHLAQPDARRVGRRCRRGSSRSDGCRACRRTGAAVQGLDGSGPRDGRRRRAAAMEVLGPAAATGPPRRGPRRAAHERLQVAGDPLRALPVRGVARVRVHHQPGAGDGGRQALLLGAREVGVRLAPQEQRRGRDPPQGRRVVEGAEPVRHGPPHPRRQLAALGHHPLEERPRDGDVDRAGLELADERLRHRLRQPPHGRPQLPRRGVHRGAEGADEHQPGGALRVGLRHAAGDEGAQRVADEARPAGADGVQEGHRVGGEVVDRVATGRAL